MKNRGISMFGSLPTNFCTGDPINVALPSIIDETSGQSLQIVVSGCALKGKLTKPIQNCWMKIWTTSQSHPIFVNLSEKILNKPSDIVRQIKTYSNDTMNLILEDSQTVQLEPSDSVEKYEISTNLAALLGVAPGISRGIISGAIDVFIHHRRCFLVCDQVNSAFSIQSSEFPVIASLNLEITANGNIVGGYTSSVFHQNNNLIRAQNLAHLTFRIVSAISPNMSLPISGASFHLTFQMNY